MDKKKVTIIAIVLGVLFVAALVAFIVRDNKVADANAQVKELMAADAEYVNTAETYAYYGYNIPYDYYLQDEISNYGAYTTVLNDNIVLLDGASWNVTAGEEQKGTLNVSLTMPGDSYVTKAVWTVDGAETEYTYVMDGADITFTPVAAPAEAAEPVAVPVDEPAATADASVEAVEEPAATADAAVEPADAQAAAGDLVYCYAINDDGSVTLTSEDGTEVLTLTKAAR
ncbi:MAG: hypothetical protein CW338_04975 [Clostridiales bacterium]|nr:hypothetical protein [Clostridiales bacterium]